MHDDHGSCNNICMICKSAIVKVSVSGASLKDIDTQYMNIVSFINQAIIQIYIDARSRMDFV